ncbi:MAG TPA: [Fe-Fe] hydrogenase large subunit C-terminal domain-containing protein [Bacteroidales bacterium]|nr:[Fe-Fe] hydrogenase large subunit C-terminal domain-containing protein [Bacteroidales bacterium]HSA42491.1 [Fe-Fe] hydrogenase large subunit C-terminal domain-containing protein [Bacteroidales bacterium]
MGIIEIDYSKCRMSYACVRICPVKAIGVNAEDDFPRIAEDRCIGCGSCILVCNQSAVSHRSDIDKVKMLLGGEQTIVAMLAPEIAAEFGDVTDYRKFVTMIKKLGFHDVCEVSFGVDLVAARYADLFTHFRGKYYISSNCPSVVAFVEKFHPKLVPNLAPFVNPMTAMAKVIRQRYGAQISLVYIGPSVNAMLEAARARDDERTDAVLTFAELRRLFEEYNITESTLEYSGFDPPFGYKGALYPIPQGYLQAGNITEDLLTNRIITTEGRENLIELLRVLDEQMEEVNHHFNVFYREGCAPAEGMTRDISRIVRRAWVVDYTAKRMSQMDWGQWKKDMEEFSGLDLSRTFNADDRRLPAPPESRIREVLKVLGKKEEDDGSSCGNCGYASCRDFAVAVAQGLAKTEMCLTFSLKNRQEYIKTLRQTNEKLAKTQEALKESEKKARLEQQHASEAMETTAAMLQKLPSGVVIVDDKLRIMQSNRRFIEILGREAGEISEVIQGLKGADLKTLIPYPFYNLFSYVLEKDDDVVNRDVHYEERILNVSVFTIRRNKVVGAVVRDMFMPEVRKEEVIRRVSEAINENLELVQKIAFLLGEGASRTEKTLNSIIEFHQNEKKGRTE